MMVSFTFYCYIMHVIIIWQNLQKSHDFQFDLQFQEIKSPLVGISMVK